jgi:hypothetical protein
MRRVSGAAATLQRPQRTFGEDSNETRTTCHLKRRASDKRYGRRESHGDRNQHLYAYLQWSRWQRKRIGGIDRERRSADRHSLDQSRLNHTRAERHADLVLDERDLVHRERRLDRHSADQRHADRHANRGRRRFIRAELLRGGGRHRHECRERNRDRASHHRYRCRPQRQSRRRRD